MNAPLYAALAMLVDAYQRCLATGNPHSLDHKLRIETLAREHLPSGSGVDNGCHVDLDKSTPERLVISTAFHHMNDGGCYDGWTNHDVIVTPSLGHGISLRITGRDRNEVKDYLSDLFYESLRSEVDVYGPPDPPIALVDEVSDLLGARE